jgi:hypothetical protein
VGAVSFSISWCLMGVDPAEKASDRCVAACSQTSSMEALNRECFCVAVDPQALHDQLDVILAGHGTSTASLIQSHPHLFSALPVYVSRNNIEQVARVVDAIHQISELPTYQGLLGFDFHLAPQGPRLIEINTNPGGALLNAMLGRAQRICMPEMTVPPTDAARTEDAILQVVLTEWRLQRADAPLGMIAIVDEAPEQQYLYPEFVLYRELFRQHGYAARICAPADLIHHDYRLWLDGTAVDFVYNRLTDFSFALPAHQALRSAYLDGEVVVSPHPRAHAIHADKRNMSLLSNKEFLCTSGLGQPSIDLLLAAVPTTVMVTAKNRDALWARRGQLFFKPAAGFGSKASYRGDKITHRVWEEIGHGAYVAQELVRPSERHVAAESPPLKVDIRCYAYAGEVLLYAARMYQGQTTNFRTPGGGFAPVLTARH